MQMYFKKLLEKGLICTLKCESGETHCQVLMTAVGNPDTPGVRFKVQGKGVSPGYHGFHVHIGGDLSDGCASLGSHYNPTNAKHGGLNQPDAHSGDLGNIYFDNHGKCSTEFVSNRLALYELIGRSLVLHGGVDDLGKGGNEESLKTGNSGSRVCCGVIGTVEGRPQ